MNNPTRIIGNQYGAIFLGVDTCAATVLPCLIAKVTKITHITHRLPSLKIISLGRKPKSVIGGEHRPDIVR